MSQRRLQSVQSAPQGSIPATQPAIHLERLTPAGAAEAGGYFCVPRFSRAQYRPLYNAQVQSRARSPLCPTTRISLPLQYLSSVAGAVRRSEIAKGNPNRRFSNMSNRTEAPDLRNVGQGRQDGQLRSDR